MSEEWKPVVGTDGRYEVSDHGRVRSWVKKGPRDGGLRDEPIVLSPALNDGYAVVHLGRLGAAARRNPRKVHQLVMGAFGSPPPTAAHEIAHVDGNRANASLNNLVWKTHQENMADTALHGTRKRGVDAPRAKLTEQNVRDLRRLHSEGLSAAAAGRLFGLHQSTACDVVNRQTWTHVE